MNELHWTELAAQVVAWHNRHPLARRISLQHVHSLGYVMLPFADAKPGTQAAPGGPDPLPPEAMSGSLRERAMARSQLETQGAAAQPGQSTPDAAAPSQLRPAFDEDFLPPHSPKALRRWAARHAVAQATPRGDVQVRKVKAEAGLPESAQLPRWLLTAQVEVGGARTRVLVGPGAKPPVLGRRLLSPVRTFALLALVAVIAGAASWVLSREPSLPVVEAAVAPAASGPASGPTSAPAAAPALVGASAPSKETIPALVAPPVAMASAVAPTLEPLHAARPASGPPVVSHEPAVAPALQPAAAASRPVDVEPQLGQVELPSLGPRIEARRRRAQEAAASAAGHAAAHAGAHGGPAAVPHATTAPTAVQAPTAGPSFAVTTRLLRTRSESDQLAAAIRELLSKQGGPPVRVEVIAVGDDWRVVGWPYADRALAEQARALLAARGMKVQVVDF